MPESENIKICWLVDMHHKIAKCLLVESEYWLVISRSFEQRLFLGQINHWGSPVPLPKLLGAPELLSELFKTPTAAAISLHSYILQSASLKITDYACSLSPCLG